MQNFALKASFFLVRHSKISCLSRKKLEMETFIEFFVSKDGMISQQKLEDIAAATPGPIL
jgi:hypothetical protein